MLYIKPIVVLVSTVITYLILESIDKKRNSEQHNSKLKIILTKLSIFLILLILYIGLIYWLDILSLLKINIKSPEIIGNIKGGDKINTDIDGIELETIKRIRENVHVGLLPENMTIGEISRK